MLRKKLLLLAALALYLFSQQVIPPNSDDEVFLYRAVAKVAPGLMPLNQKNIGSCVAAGHAGACNVCMALDKVAGKTSKFLPASIESIYGGARNEASGRVGHSYQDGSSGYAATTWLSKVGGVIYAQAYPEYNIDLTTYDVPRCKSWGAISNGGDNTVTGPLDVEAKKHPIKAVAKVTTLDELDAALKNGFPVTICSGIGFNSPRDKDGFCQQAGAWGHCLLCAGKRNEGRKGYLIFNSWGTYLAGDGAHSTNKYKDQPDGSFYAEPAVVARMLKAGDSWALSGETGLCRISFRIG